MLAEEVGNNRFLNFQVVDSVKAGFQTHITNYTSTDSSIENWVIVGRSTGNAAPLAYHLNSRGIITPRTDGFTAKNVQFFNFDTGMSILQSCSECQSVLLW